MLFPIGDVTEMAYSMCVSVNFVSFGSIHSTGFVVYEIGERETEIADIWKVVIPWEDAPSDTTTVRIHHPVVQTKSSARHRICPTGHTDETANHSNLRNYCYHLEHH